MTIRKLMAGNLVILFFLFAVALPMPTPADETQPWTMLGFQLPPGEPAEPGRAEFEAIGDVSRSLYTQLATAFQLVDLPPHITLPFITTDVAQLAHRIPRLPQLTSLGQIEEKQHHFLNLLKQSAQYEFSPAEAMLSFYYYYGYLGLPNNLNIANSLAHRSAARNNLDGLALVALLDARLLKSAATDPEDAADQRRIKEILSDAHKSAFGGSVIGQWILSILLESIDSHSNNSNLDWVAYSFAALANERGLYSADVTLQHFEKQFSHESVAKGQQAVGDYFYHGSFGAPKDPIETAKWWLKAANSGNALAQFGLGRLYHDGVGVPRDYTQALKWYRLAAAQGQADAENNMGLMFLQGEGGAVNYAEALRLFSLAAQQGRGIAMNNLGILYANGLGVAHDPKIAFTWFRKAVDHGYAAAKGNIAALTEASASLPSSDVRSGIIRTQCQENCRSEATFCEENNENMTGIKTLFSDDMTEGYINAKLSETNCSADLDICESNCP